MDDLTWLRNLGAPPAPPAGAVLDRAANDLNAAIAGHPRRRPTRRHSLRSRLLVMLLGTLVLAGVGGGVAAAMTGYMNQIPTAKAAIIAREQAARVAGRDHRAPKSTPATPEPAGPSQAPSAGIQATHQGPFSPVSFTVENVWTGRTDGRYYTVWAGAQTALDSGSQAEAAVIVYADPANVNAANATPVRVGLFHAGTGTSPLAIRAYSHGVLTLTDTTHHRIRFDVQTRKFQH